MRSETMLRDAWRVQKKAFTEESGSRMRVVEESMHDSEEAAQLAFDSLRNTPAQRVELQRRSAGQSRYRSLREKGYCAKEAPAK